LKGLVSECRCRFVDQFDIAFRQLSKSATFLWHPAGGF
jgi:hypothetical protein